MRKLLKSFTLIESIQEWSFGLSCGAAPETCENFGWSIFYALTALSSYSFLIL